MFSSVVSIREEAGEGGASEELGSAGETPPALLGSNPFLAPASGDGIIYKKGYIMRKCCTDPNGKKSELWTDYQPQGSSAGALAVVLFILADLRFIRIRLLKIELKIGNINTRYGL